MRRGRLKVFASLMLVTASGCRMPSSPNDALECGLATQGGGAALGGGSFDYIACDADGRLLLVGQLALETTSGGVVTGTWMIGWVPGADRNVNVGPQIGSGELQGFFNAGQLMVDLNPGWADNNVYLAAEWQPGGGRGTWSWSTIIGPQAGGRFVARSR